MPRESPSVRPVALALCAMIMAGCASTDAGPGAHAGETYIVKTDHALFYSYGPSQPGLTSR